MCRIHIGSKDHEFIAIEIVARAASEFGPLDFWENNWLRCLVEVRAGGLRGNVECHLLTEDFVRLRDIVRDLHDWSENFLEFGTLEGWLTIAFTLDEKGGITLLGDLVDRPTDGNRLRFHLTLDQSYLPSILSDLDRAIKSYPVVGIPPLPQ
jgi:hypothetical protein